MRGLRPPHTQPYLYSVRSVARGTTRFSVGGLSPAVVRAIARIQICYQFCVHIRKFGWTRIKSLSITIGKPIVG